MLERPLIYLVPPAAAALYCAVCLDAAPGPHLSLLLLAVFLIAAGALVHHARPFAVCCMLAAASFAFSGFAVYRINVVEPVRELAGQNKEITATVLQDPDIYEDSQRAELSVDDAEWLPGSFRMQCYLPLTDEPLLAGDRIKVNVGFIFRAQRRALTVLPIRHPTAGILQAPIQRTTTMNQFPFQLPRRKGMVCAGCRSVLRGSASRLVWICSPNGRVVCSAALLIGDTATLPDDDTLAFQISGLSHMVAVSGMHVAFLVAFCYLLFGRRIGTWASIPLILFFVPIAGATPSVIRAAVMYLIAAGAFIIRRETSSVN